jgi:hypothetical protein
MLKKKENGCVSIEKAADATGKKDTSAHIEVLKKITFYQKTTYTVMLGNDCSPSYSNSTYISNEATQIP